MFGVWQHTNIVSSYDEMKNAADCNCGIFPPFTLQMAFHFPTPICDHLNANGSDSNTVEWLNCIFSVFRKIFFGNSEGCLELALWTGNSDVTGCTQRNSLTAIFTKIQILNISLKCYDGMLTSRDGRKTDFCSYIWNKLKCSIANWAATPLYQTLVAYRCSASFCAICKIVRAIRTVSLLSAMAILIYISWKTHSTTHTHIDLTNPSCFRGTDSN